MHWLYDNTKEPEIYEWLHSFSANIKEEEVAAGKVWVKKDDFTLENRKSWSRPVLNTQK